jgi:hypothetical protein
MIILVVGVLIFVSEKQQKNDLVIDLESVDTVFVTDLDDFKSDMTKSFDDIAKNIASPVEIAASIKHDDYEYFKDALLDVKLSNYITSRDKALILGGIGVDLMYINFYEKSSAMLIPLNQIRRLSNDLYISQFFNFNDLKRLASSSLTKQDIDSLIYITTYNLNQIEDYLLSAERVEIGVYMVLGAWTEGIHLLTYYANKYNDDKINERVAEQQFFLKELLKLLNKYKKNKNIKIVLKKIEPIKELLFSIEFEYENLGKPWKTVDINGKETWYQWQKSIALVDSSQILAISNQMELFRNDIFKLQN